MMEKLNSKVGSIVWKVIFALIAVSFILGGVGSYLGSNVKTYVAKVNDQEIDYRVFQTAFNNEQRRISQQMGEQFSVLMETPDFEKNLKQNVLDQLINEALVEQYIQKLGLAASDAQIKQSIVAEPMFQTEGRFDNQKYQQLLQNNGISADYYATIVRANILLNQLQQGIVGTEFVTKSELDQMLQHFYQQRTAQLTAVPISLVPKAQIADEEITNYYQQNQGAFLIPELIKVEYVDISSVDIEKMIEISDIEIAQYYQDNKSLFQQTQQHLAHIQLTDAQQAQELYQQISAGEDFATLAKSYSQDKLSAVNGGDLSWSSKGTYPLAFESAVESLGVGEVSQPVKVDDAYHIIKVLDRKNTGVLSLAEVKSQVVDMMKQELVLNRFFSIEKDVAEKAFEHPDSIEGVAKIINKPVVTTAFFSRQDVPVALNYPNVINYLFDTNGKTNGVNSGAMSVGEQHTIVARVVDHKPAGTLPLEDAKADIVSLLQQEKAKSLLLSDVQNTIQKLNNGENVALPYGITLSEEASVLNYADMRDVQLRNAIFSVPEGEFQRYHLVSNQNNEIFIVKIVDSTSVKVDEKQKTELFDQYRNFVQQQTYANLLSSLRNVANIEINQELLQVK